MACALSSERGRGCSDARGVARAVPRATPLMLVAGAVAGDDLGRVAAATAGAISAPVAITIPRLGEPVVAPPDSIVPAVRRELAAHAGALARGEGSDPPRGIGESVAVRIGEQVVGVVAACAGPAHPEQRAWLEGAAAAAAVTAMMHEAQCGAVHGSRRALLQALVAGPPADVAAWVGHARELGLDLGRGGLGIGCGSRRGTASLRIC